MIDREKNRFHSNAKNVNLKIIQVYFIYKARFKLNLLVINLIKLNISIYISIYLYIYPSIYLSIYLSRIWNNNEGG